MKNKTLIVLLFAAAALITCKREELPKVDANGKVELTVTADTVSYVFASFGCSLSEKANFAVERYGFCWDTLPGVTVARQCCAFSNLFGTTFQKDVNGLKPNTKYYLKAYLEAGDATIYSKEVVLQTANAKPIVTTAEVNSVKANRAACGGNALAYEELFPITQRGVCWAKTSSPTITDSISTDSIGNGTFASNMANLNAGIKYYVRAYAKNSEGVGYGLEKAFTTLDGIPELATDSVNNVTATSATVYGMVSDNDGLDILEKGFCWGRGAILTTDSSHQAVSGNQLGNFALTIGNLLLGTNYYATAYVKNSEGTYYAQIPINFTTKDGLPTVSTGYVSDITATTATCGGNVTDDGGFAVTARGVCWSTSFEPTIENDSHTTDGSTTGVFSNNLEGLALNTTYYVRAYATNVNGTAYGSEVIFTTKDGLPIVTTNDVTDITPTTATCGGNITADGGASVTARGVVWGTAENPTLDSNTEMTTDGEGTGSFTSNLTGLTLNTTYYVRAYATNSIGTEYGNQQPFTTLDGIAVLTTTEVSEITPTTATCGGNITADGGASVTARGVVWGTEANPTVDSNTGIATDGTGTGSFTSSLTGLTPGTTYYARAYATNSVGTEYGNQQSFITYNADAITDYDGNYYNTVTIGNQTWMAENLKVNHYNDGTAIPNVTDGNEWAALTTGAYCWYSNDATAYKDTYGALYNWYAVNTGKLAPTGWHVPTDAEWSTLTTYLGGESVAGGKLKETGTTHWTSPNTGATNETGFTALPGGYRYYNGNFYYVGLYGFWWSSTELDTINAWYRTMRFNLSSVNRCYNNKSCGFSVRCVRD